MSVEVAGPTLPDTFTLVPDTIQSMAAQLVNECVGRSGRQGGFATFGIGKLIDYVVDPSTDLEAYRKLQHPWVYRFRRR